MIAEPEEARLDLGGHVVGARVLREGDNVPGDELRVREGDHEEEAGERDAAETPRSGLLRPVEPRRERHGREDGHGDLRSLDDAALELERGVGDEEREERRDREERRRSLAPRDEGSREGEREQEPVPAR